MDSIDRDEGPSSGQHADALGTGRPRSSTESAGISRQGTLLSPAPSAATRPRPPALRQSSIRLRMIPANSGLGQRNAQPAVTGASASPGRPRSSSDSQRQTPPPPSPIPGPSTAPAPMAPLQEEPSQNTALSRHDTVPEPFPDLVVEPATNEAAPHPVTPVATEPGSRIGILRSASNAARNSLRRRRGVSTGTVQEGEYASDVVDLLDVIGGSFPNAIT